jgi:hypothetical protein
MAKKKKIRDEEEAEGEGEHRLGKTTRPEEEDRDRYRYSQVTLDQPLPSLFHLRALPLLSQSTCPLAHHPLDLFPDHLQVPAQDHRVQALLLSIFPGGLVEVLFLQSRRDGAEDLLFFRAELLYFGL